MIEFRSTLAATPGFERGLFRSHLETVQINLGKKCNQACRHCHVDASPNRSEMMQSRTLDRTLSLIQRTPGLTTVDITGGAPELHPEFTRLVIELKRLNLRVIDRCNLTILLEPGFEEMAAFLAAHRVEIIASLPCYSPGNVNFQRGLSVFEKSIEALTRLNHLGYGQAESDLKLDLVYNPLGAHLPPPQAELEKDYKKRLKEDFGIVFNRLYTITNMPIARFKRDLVQKNEEAAYMALLRRHFNERTLPHVMCRSMISVGWNGLIYDCDFNQMLEIGVLKPKGATVFDVRSFVEMGAALIAVGDHCYGCTAGAGSSCQGSFSA